MVIKDGPMILGFEDSAFEIPTRINIMNTRKKGPLVPYYSNMFLGYITIWWKLEVFHTNLFEDVSAPAPTVTRMQMNSMRNHVLLRRKEIL